jgi:hypothetical protein
VCSGPLGVGRFCGVSIWAWDLEPVVTSGSADYRRQVLQSTLTQALGVALAGFRKLDDLPSERLTKWIGVGEGGPARRFFLVETAALLMLIFLVKIFIGCINEH